MSRRSPQFHDTLKTLTHARLRAAQGDVAGAAAVLRELIEQDPSDAEAGRLLAELGEQGAAGPEPVESTPDPVVPGDPEQLAEWFRTELRPSPGANAAKIRRLRAWLARIREAD